jgi:hypothetical protein
VTVPRSPSARASDVVPLPVAPAAPDLGPAVVVAAPPGRWTVRLADGREVPARVALAQPYEARPGDEVLVIGNAAGHYVIGVLVGAGRTSLELPGDVTLRAVGGTLRLEGDVGVEIAAPEARVRASKLEVLAGSVVETFVSLRQRVAELWSVRAGEAHTLVEGASHTQAKSATILSEKTVTINGKAVHLG